MEHEPSQLVLLITNDQAYIGSQVWRILMKLNLGDHCSTSRDLCLSFMTFYHVAEQRKKRVIRRRFVLPNLGVYGINR